MENQSRRQESKMELLSERSKIPIRSGSSANASEITFQTRRQSLISKSRKRNSMAAYPLQSSKLPIPISSCTNLGSSLNDQPILSQNNHNTKRYSFASNQYGKTREANRFSVQSEDLHPESNGISERSCLPTFSALTLDSNLNMSPSTNFVTDAALTVRSINVVKVDHRQQQSRKNQLKFSYFTEPYKSVPPLVPSAKLNRISVERNQRKSHTNSTQNSCKNGQTLSRRNNSTRHRRKLNDLDELITKVKKDNILKKKLENCQSTRLSTDGDDKRDFYAFEDLSSKRPDLFQKLTMYERIMQYPKIYFTGLSKDLKIKSDLKFSKNNHGFDDNCGNYIILPGDHIIYKYEISMVLGNGAFGSVVSVLDHSSKTRKKYACKIVKNDPRWSLQAVEEIKILRKLSHPNIINYVEHFTFRSHMCILTEILGITLYESIQANDYRGFSLKLVKKFTKEILQGISYLHSKNIIHCDLKPENIMISGDGIIKLIDFGSSCHLDHLKYSYLQSRFYRAPEVLLGARYDTKMDIWSIALISLELFAGVPLFQPQSEWELFCYCVNYMNIPSRKYILQLREEIEKLGFVGTEKQAYNDLSKNTLLWKAFGSSGIVNNEYVNQKLSHTRNIDHKQLNAGHGSIKNFLRKHADHESFPENSTYGENVTEINRFLVFIEMCLVWNKWGRASADKCLRLDFFASLQDHD